MKPAEIRRGNLYDTLNRSGNVALPLGVPMKILSIGPFEVEALRHNLVPAEHPWNKIRISDLCQLPINEKNLARMGFYKDLEIDPTIYKNTTLKYQAWQISVDEKNNFFIKFGDEKVILRSISHFQNLYFDFTNEELIFQ